MTSGLKITFVLPFIEKTGGVIVVFEHARQLRKMGHDVRIVYPLLPYHDLFLHVPAWKRAYGMFRYALSAWRKRKRPAPWFSDDPQAGMIPMVSRGFVPSGDFVIATTWPTAYSVASLPESCGKKLYFIQHHEVWTGNVAAVDRSFALGLGLVTIAPWLTALMREKFGRNVVAEIHNGIDLHLFHPPVAKPADSVSVLMMFHTAAYKGVDDGLRVLRRLSEAFPEIRIRLFGQYDPSEEARGYEYFLNPTPAELVCLYQSAHIFLSPSIAEGWHLPPMEAMACGCAVVATQVGCIPVLDEGDNMLTARPGDADALFRCVERLVRDQRFREGMARRGLDTVRRYDWPAKSAEFETVLRRLSAAADDEKA